MGFWIFMLIMDLLIPFTMIGFGKILINMEIKDKSGGCHENSSIFPRNWLSL